MRRTSPRPLGVALRVLSERLAPVTVLAEVQRVWPDVVGPTIARVASPVREREGVLTVICNAAVWAQELDLMGDSVVAHLNERLARDAVRSLRCRVGTYTA